MKNIQQWWKDFFFFFFKRPQHLFSLFFKAVESFLIRLMTWGECRLTKERFCLLRNRARQNRNMLDYCVACESNMNKQEIVRVGPFSTVRKKIVTCVLIM